jgi:hypothetical protein
LPAWLLAVPMTGEAISAQRLGWIEPPVMFQ